MTTARRTPLALACILLCGGVTAQIRTDGTVGAAQALQGPAYQIPQALGRLSGGNLFHSFQRFGIGAQESATFSTGAGVANVISRVTGGEASAIHGTLRLAAAEGAPGFFFINPAGVTFGAGATIDVPGAFHVGTADYVKFPDGRFEADPAKASSFSSAPPEAFGFLGTQRTLALVEGARLVVRQGHVLTLAGGDVLMDGAVAATVGGGDLRVAAVGTAAVEVPMQGALPASTGSLRIRNEAALTTASDGAQAGGRLVVSAGEMQVDSGAYLYSLGPSVAADQGPGGDIEVSVVGTLALAGGASISSETYGAGAAGALRVQAGQIRLDGEAYLFSNAAAGSSGSPGAIEISTPGRLALIDGSSISTSAYGAGAGRAITLDVGEMAVDGGAYVQSEGLSGSSAIAITVAGDLGMSNKGRIVTATSGAAGAGTLAVRAGRARLDTEASIGSQTTGDGAAGTVDVAVRGDLQLAGGGWIYSVSNGGGSSGRISVSAATLAMDAGAIRSNAVHENSSAQAGDIAVQVGGALTLSNLSSIDSSTLTHGRAGHLQVRASDVVLDSLSRINSSAVDGTGRAGALDLVASGKLVMRGEAVLSTDSRSLGDAGEVRVSAASIDMAGEAAITSRTYEHSLGRGGSVQVTTGGALTMRDAAYITALGAGVGDAGHVQVQAGSVLMDSGARISTLTYPAAIGNAGQLRIEAAGDIVVRGGAYVVSDAYGVGNAGGVSVVARNVTVADGGRIAGVTTSPIGTGGRITVQASGELAVLGGSGAEDPGGSISTSTFGAADGGAIAVTTGSLRMAGYHSLITSFAQEGATGHAGSIDVQASGLVSLSDRAGVSTSTRSQGDGGAVRVRAAELRLEGLAAISSSALPDSSGNAGSVDVQVSGDLVLRNAGLSSSTAGLGAAGAVQVQAARVTLQGAGISAAEENGLSGRTGNVTVLASESIRLTEGSSISIMNAGVVNEPQTRLATTLRLAAPSITLDHAVMTAEAGVNVAASAITVDAARLTLTGSAITTRANAGNGGPITVQASDRLLLRGSAITTSVVGARGDGGDIAIATPALVLETGFVQANTAARNAAGGLVRIDARSLVASGNTLLLGGDTPYAFRPDVPGFNVIQAAAPTGVSGVVEVTSPVLDVTGSLRGLGGQVIDAGGLGRSLCQASGGSSLAQGGRGGLVASAQGFLRAEGDAAPMASLRDEPPPVALAGLRSARRGCL